MITFHPAVLYLLAPDDDGYDRGARFRLDQLDGGQYAFKSADDAQKFASIHDMSMVNEDEMAELRRVLMPQPRPAGAKQARRNDGKEGK